MRQTDPLLFEPLSSHGQLLRLIQAVLGLGDTLRPHDMLQDVNDSASSLTQARYAMISTASESGQLDDFLASGMTAAECQRLEESASRKQMFEYIQEQPSPLRLSDLGTHLRSAGGPDLQALPFGPFLAAPLQHGDERLGYIIVARPAGDTAFSQEDERALVIFAAQAAKSIGNARRYRDEQRRGASLRAQIDSAPVGIVSVSARTGAVLSINREARRILESLCPPGRPPEQLLQMLRVRRPDGQELYASELPISQLLEEAGARQAEPIVLSVPDGPSITVLVSITPQRSDQNGELESIMVAMQDMNPLEDLERIPAEFLGMVSHELREPLTSIKGSVATLLEFGSALEPGEIVQFHRIINEQADYMRDLISELLDVAQIETGTLSITPARTKVGHLIDEAHNILIAAGRHRNVVIDVEPDLPDVMADRYRIVQVLGNLLNNAAHYSNRTSPITLSAGPEEGFVVFAVLDRGRGVPPERLPFLFRKFSRVDDADRNRQTSGSGLGLAISKGIVEAHGGRIWAESAGAGQGTKVSFTLPVANVLASSTTTGSTQAPGRIQPDEQRELRVLVVDDDPTTLKCVRDTLVAEGYTVLVSPDPNEALHMFESERPHLVLMDLVLPGSDGIEVMQNMLEKSMVPVVFLSAYGRDEIIERAFEAGAVDYMVKPFSPRELIARVRGAIRRPLVPAQVDATTPFSIGDLTINYLERRVTMSGRPVRLSPTEYALLFELSLSAGRVVTFGELLDRVWGVGHTGGRGSVRTYIKRLRRKLGEDARNPRYIFAERSIGYRMPSRSAASEDDQANIL